MRETNSVRRCCGENAGGKADKEGKPAKGGGGTGNVQKLLNQELKEPGA